MKFKQRVVIVNPDSFLRGDYQACFTLLDHKTGIDKWIDCGEIEFELDVDTQQITKTVAGAIEDEIKKEQSLHDAKMVVLKARLSELLAIEYTPQETK